MATSHVASAFLSSPPVNVSSYSVFPRSGKEDDTDDLLKIPSHEISDSRGSEAPHFHQIWSFGPAIVDRLILQVDSVQMEFKLGFFLSMFWLWIRVLICSDPMIQDGKRSTSREIMGKMMEGGLGKELRIENDAATCT
ncbi:hypothetical protein M5K25_019340 [Dendrobium thyrsiflorum]|uniref:Uncharacterized protein n=1 Tax=Dendrobium thyrsiflorum TaxID=117978 RepID=A0ABD0ULD7_DENTH